LTTLEISPKEFPESPSKASISSTVCFYTIFHSFQAKPGRLKPKKEIEVKPKNLKGKIKKKSTERVSLNDLLENLK
jgi:hypothetical protein